LLAAAVLASPVAALSAFAAPCPPGGTAAQYDAAGFSCNVGPVIFSDIDFVPQGGASITQVDPVTFNYLGSVEYGLRLAIISVASGINDASDVLWNYTVSAAPGYSLVDVYASFTGTHTGDGLITLSEVFTPPVTSFALNEQGIAYALISPTSSLFAVKDQMNFTGDLGGTAATSAIINAYSVSAVPLPGAAMLFGSALAGLAGFGAFRRRRVASPPVAV